MASGFPNVLGVNLGKSVQFGEGRRESWHFPVEAGVAPCDVMRCEKSEEASWSNPSPYRIELSTSCFPSFSFHVSLII